MLISVMATHSARFAGNSFLVGVNGSSVISDSSIVVTIDVAPIATYILPFPAGFLSDIDCGSSPASSSFSFSSAVSSFVRSRNGGRT